MCAMPNANEHKRTLLIHHAARVFIARGYEHATLDEIADAAGIGKASVYRLVGDKANLLEAVMRHASEYIISACRIVLDRSVPAEEMLTRFAERYIAAMYEPFAGGAPFYQVARLMIAVSFDMPDLMHHYIDTYFERGVRPIAEYLAARTDAGELDSGDIEDAITFIQLIFYTDREIANRAAEIPAGGIHAVANRQVRRFLYGCSKRVP